MGYKLRDQAVRFFAREDIWSNLVTMSDVARRTGMNTATIATWKGRYADFPEPVKGTMRSDKEYAHMALYWWPDIQAFMKDHDLPGGHPGRKKGSGREDGTVEDVAGG